MVFFFLFGLYSVEMGGSVFPLEDGHSGSLEEFSDPDFEELQKEQQIVIKFILRTLSQWLSQELTCISSSLNCSKMTERLPK